MDKLQKHQPSVQHARERLFTEKIDFNMVDASQNSLREAFKQLQFVDQHQLNNRKQ